MSELIHDATADRRSRLWDLYQTMSRLRAFEEVASEAARDGALNGLLHLGIGGEALTAGLFDCLREEDRVYVSHRPHQQFVAGGSGIREVFAELAGKETGVCRGRGGSMHLASERVVMATGIVGGTMSIAVGHALMMPPGGVVVAVFGDGAVQTGAFHESLNLAAVWHVPVLFVCENNGKIEFSTREEHTNVGAITDYGDLYGIPAASVDGTSVENVIGVVSGLLEGIRRGEGPALLDARTVRLRPHYEGDFRERTAETDFLESLQDTLAELGVERRDVKAVYENHLDEMNAVRRSVLESDPDPDPADDARLVFSKGL